MKKRFIVICGWIRSPNDGDKHFISCDRLSELYRVDPRECVYFDPSKDKSVGYGHNNLIHLRPLPDGNYEEALRDLCKKG